MYEITGILKVKKETKQATETFKVREFILTDPSTQYPQHIAFQVTQERCSLLDNFREGDSIKLGFYIKGREWQSKEGEMRYFNSLEAWKIEAANSSAATPAPGSAEKSFTEEDVLRFETTKKAVLADEEEDDLPF